MMFKKSTDLQVIMKLPRRYVWGEIKKIHEIGRYHIVESLDFLPDNAAPGRERKITFHIYVDGQNTSHGSNTMEGALITAIAFGQIENSNGASHMAAACCKLLDIED